MNPLARDLLKVESWAGLLMGNHGVARAMLEAGVSVITSYPGSPVPEIGTALQSIPEEKQNFYFEYSTNEKVAAEIAFGAAINGHLSAVFFKSVGLNVASDAIIQIAMLEITGGMVIILGDDPGANSSQNEQDNRYMAQMMYIPLLEPATPGEAYSMFLEAVALSRKHRIPVFLRLTTHVCHAQEVIRFGDLPRTLPDRSSLFDPASHSYFPLVAESMRLKGLLLEKLKKISRESLTFTANHLYTAPGQCPPGEKPGIITAGMPALGIQEVLSEEEVGMDILKLGLVYPFPEPLVLKFLEEHDQVLIVEELDPYLEKAVKALAWDHNLKCRILSKEERFRQGEIGPREAREILHTAWPGLIPSREERVSPGLNLPLRTAQFCAGCGHRSAFYAIKQALPGGDTTFTVAGIGCHLMGHFDPYNVGQVLLCMGHSPSTATGLSLFNNKSKVIAFLGDSTFFHSGLPAVVNAAVYNHNITLIIMDNHITAMTGHQANPGTGKLKRVNGQEEGKITPFQVLESLNIGFLERVDAFNQQKLKETVQRSLEYKGFAVIIARHPCMLQFTREKRNKMKIPVVEVK